MKKIITLSTLCVMAGLLFSSCKGGISIAKRHYNKGYYIAYGHKRNKQTVRTPKEEQKIAKVEIAIPEHTIPVNLEKSIDKVYSAQIVVTNNNVVTVSNEKKQHKAFSKVSINFGLNLKHKIKVIEYQPVQIKRNLLGVKKIYAGPAGEVLSLFWIVILVILILWLVGLLAGGWGLGGFINLFLLVALILLVLWLLKIL